MRPQRIAPVLITLVVTLIASAAMAGGLDGTVKLGGIFLDEEGDFSAVQETYNIYDGFAISQIHLLGTPNPRNYFMLDLSDINLDSRKGHFVYRMPGTLKLTGDFLQHRQVFSQDRAVTSSRKNWDVGAQYNPMKWLSLSGFVSQDVRDGDRLSFPVGTQSVLGTEYDNSLLTGQLTADFHSARRGGSISYRGSSFEDKLNETADRTGQVVSARLYAPAPFYEKWTSLVRGAYGKSEHSSSGLDYTLTNFQYTGIVEPLSALQFKYRFDANRIDNESTDLQTDRFQNDFDVTVFQPQWRLGAGYGYEMNDDDRSLTSYHSWRVGGAFHHRNIVNIKADYAGRVKTDTEELTLLKDIEAFKVRAKLDVRPIPDFVLGGGYSKREREFPDIAVKSEGDVVNAFGRYEYPGWGNISADYTYSDDAYKDLAGRFDTYGNTVTGRVEFERIKNVRLAGGATFLNVLGDLDIEKSMMFAEGSWSPIPNYHIEVMYNIYNYDDYILIDRYYTANVVRINLAYDLHL